MLHTMLMMRFLWIFITSFSICVADEVKVEFESFDSTTISLVMTLQTGRSVKDVKASCSCFLGYEVIGDSEIKIKLRRDYVNADYDYSADLVLIYDDGDMEVKKVQGHIPENDFTILGITQFKYDNSTSFSFYTSLIDERLVVVSKNLEIAKVDYLNEGKLTKVVVSHEKSKSTKNTISVYPYGLPKNAISITIFRLSSSK